MTDVSTAEMPLEPAPIPQEPEAIAEVETAPAEAPAERGIPFDVEHLGVLRRSVLDHLVDTDEPQSVAQILAAMPAGVTRNSLESAIRREYESGRIERVAPGTYKLAPPKPPGAKPAAPPEPDKSEAEWHAAFEAWVNDPESWSREVLGPRPNEAGRRIPADIVAKGADRGRKRVERRLDREEALARQAAADGQLRSALLTACHGNCSPTLQVDDLAPIREVLKVLPLDRVVMVIRQKVDRRCYPGNPPLVSWRDPAFLRALAEDFCQAFAIPGLVREWGNAGRTPATKAHESSPPAGDMPDDNIDRNRHDQEHAPPGPHSLAADAAVAMQAPGKHADAAEAPAAVCGGPAAWIIPGC